MQFSLDDTLTIWRSNGHNRAHRHTNRPWHISASKHTHIQLFLEQHHDTAARLVSSTNTNSGTHANLHPEINKRSECYCHQQDIFDIIVSHEVTCEHNTKANTPHTNKMLTFVTPIHINVNFKMGTLAEYESQHIYDISAWCGDRLFPLKNSPSRSGSQTHQQVLPLTHFVQ